MSRSDEVNKMTENVYKGILDQFNPSLKNFVTMGKHYEKALTGVTVAAKGYFDTLVKLGELASDSQGSKELGDTLFQMAEVHRQIQVQLEDVLKLFHSELLSQLEQKLELDIKYLTATLKKYQSERKSKVESIERCQSQLKKLRRKSQASRHPNKYGDREMQYVELMSRRQGELDSLVAVGYRSALTEERRRYCFLVDRQCSVTKILTNYHCKVRELLSQKLSSWQQSCAQPTKLPERALSLLRHTAPQSSGGAGLAEVLRNAKLGITQPAEQVNRHVKIPEFIFLCLCALYNCMLWLCCSGSTLPRVLPLCAPSRVEALFPHSPDSCEAEKPGDRGGSSCLLSFLPGDALSLLISEPRDGWHYGQNERTGRKGWFPFSYTQPFPNTPGQDLSPPALSKVNSTSMGQLDRLPPAGQMPQVSPDSEDERSVLSQRISTFRPRPYSMMNPETSRMRTSTDFTSTPPSPSRINPFAHIRLKKTVTNDRSAPLIQQSL
ncbi:brain-specific angiogenesis inhibitor 1-associated protein 2-like [Sinocyclocheilus anshuiensis]|uniref:brain-specific angiogenesis inhibitor 1-associated protein 2-like n=1 Tax=Sinocyclocheilus anshuiensis TaxID=1608454 RepID=UPI0007B8C63D|nr:PREDICTED: brain-specific angiogenesis inhibitor 1-associated protein 2-like [Sinocyclocheilus anshuiensis]